jgi:hypothetical protein
MIDLTRASRRLCAAALTTIAVVAGVAGPAAAHGKRPEVQRSDVYTTRPLELVDGARATLVRTDRAVHALVSTRQLEPAAYTLWWVVWNNPEACGDDGCDEADLGAPGIDVDIGYAAGALVRRNGRAYFAATLREGPLEGFPQEFGLTTGTGLTDARKSEIHVVIRTHGPRIRGLTGSMLTTFHGGCDYSVFGGLIDEGAYGLPGPNTCTDVQFAVFK